MTKINQDFELYYGDNAQPTFSILNAAGAALDLSTVSEIDWLCHDKTGTVKITKNKSGGSVTFQTPPGTNGIIQVALVPNDTIVPGLYGWYWHSVRLTDGTGQLTVVEVGRLMVKKREKGV